MYYTHDFSNKIFPTRKACEDDLLTHLDENDIAESMKKYITFSEIIMRSNEFGAERFYNWFKNEVANTTLDCLNRHIDEQTEPWRI